MGFEISCPHARALADQPLSRLIFRATARARARARAKARARARARARTGVWVTVRCRLYGARLY